MANKELTFRETVQGCGCLLLFGAVLLSGAWLAWGDDDASAPAPTVVAFEPKWFEVGTLHVASAAEWRSATEINKLATCGDFLWALNEAGQLKPGIIGPSPESARVPARQLMQELDVAMANPEHRVPVSQAAVVTIALMGWSATPTSKPPTP